ncbi:MAG: right-handed parallel beta-helix repeat-containing protein [Hyphomicrobiaceae bacterium]|nr:right-handed parallel beta-helix repeat-containing protein [Hyphomicrobiaceae bacterium]
MTARVSRWAAFPLVCTILALICIAPAHATGQLGHSGKFTGWWELGGFYGTDDTSRGEAVLFTPLMQSATTLFFLDARGKLFEDDVQEANIALGYRQMMASGWNLGLWGGWDVRNTEAGNSFHQVSFGVEALSERYDLRVNGYVPVTDPKVSPSLAEVVLQGNNIFLIGGEEVPLHGVDGEMGILLFGRGGDGGLKDGARSAKRHELRAYAGGFWFDADDALEEVAGPKGRLEYRINDVIASLPGSRLTIESELSHDDVRDTRFEIGARLRIPFGSRGSDAASRTAALNAQELRMIEGLERDTDIVTVQSKEENVIDDATNVALNAVSFASNANQLTTAVDQGGNRLIILQGNGAQIDVSATDGQQLQADQTVQGGSSTILMRGAKSGTVAPFKAPGARPTLFSSDTNSLAGAITLASNTHVAGLNIRGVGDQNTAVANNFGIRGLNSLNNVVIEQTDLRETGATAIQLGNKNSNIKIHQTYITNVGGSGIIASSSTSNFSVWNTDVINARNSGIRVSSDSTNLDFWNVNINGTLQDNGLEIGSNSSNATIRDSVISNVDQEGIFIQGGSRDIGIHNVLVQNTGAEGIQFGSNHSNVSLSNVTITEAGQQGIFLDDNNSNFTFRNVTVARNGSGNGIEFDNNNSNFTFDGVTTIDTDQDGFDFGSNNTNVTITNTMIINAGRDGIEFLGNNENVRIVNTTIINPDQEGIDFSTDNKNVLIADSTIAGGAQGMFDGIEMSNGNTVTIKNVYVSNAGFDGIEVLGSNNIVDIRNVSITNATLNGLGVVGFTNNVTMNDTAFSGTFGDDVIDINQAGNTLGGTGNTFNGSFGGTFCENPGAQNGSFGFDAGPQATCP